MKTNNKAKSWILFIVSLLAIVFLIYFTQGTNNGTRINAFGTSDNGKGSVVELIGAKKDNDGKWIFDKESSIKYISINTNGVGFVILKNSKCKLDTITQYSDHYFYLLDGDEKTKLQEIVDDYNLFVQTHNATAGEGDKYISIVGIGTIPVGTSWWEAILPYLSIIIIVILGVILIKSILGANAKSFSFGKTKAQVTHNTNVKFSDVAGIDEEKEELQEVVEFLKNPQKFTELGAKIPKGILLVGLPGTGKTLLAKAIAGESNVPFFSISGSDFVEMFVGVGASRVRDLFEQAKKEAPCIVFIDEIDAVGRQRGAGLGGGNDEREQTLNQLLVQMDGFEGNTGVIVIAATNRADVLDPALLRPGRFDRQIYVNPPDVRGREMILKIHARNKPMDESVDFKNLARLTSGFTGADLENLLNEAAILAARENRKKITMVDISESINKVIMGPQKRSRVVSESDNRITACHESGHAIIGKVLSHCDVVQEVSIIARGMAAGYTISRPENDESHMSYNKLIDNITMMLGGRVAEEIFIKDISTGASNDIERATKIARKMVTEWGMSSKLGTINYGSSNEVFLGRDYQNQVSYSEKTASEIDEEVKKIISNCYARATDIIKSHLKEMNTMVEVLLEKETIYFNEVDLIMKGKTTKQILNIMEKEEIRNKAKIEVERAEAELEKVKKEQAIRIKTAEALKKGGIITTEEIEKIKLDSELIIKQNEEKVRKVKEQYENNQKIKDIKENEENDIAQSKDNEIDNVDITQQDNEEDSLKVVTSTHSSNPDGEGNRYAKSNISVKENNPQKSSKKKSSDTKSIKKGEKDTISNKNFTKKEKIAQNNSTKNKKNDKTNDTKKED